MLEMVRTNPLTGKDHEAGRRWLESGAFQVHHVQQMLGYADLRQTSTYLNATVKGIEDSMRRHDEQRGLLHSVAQEADIAPPPDCNDDPAEASNPIIN
jgi:hypothetical protein